VLTIQYSSLSAGLEVRTKFRDSPNVNNFANNKT
jgi:hypothetical protein